MSPANDSKFDLDKVVDYVESNKDSFRTALEGLARIPSVSAAGFPPEELQRSAEAICEAMREAGLANAQVLKLPNVHPYIYGEWLGAGKAATVLLYGHHDVQPPGRPEKWLSPAFEPALRGDGRLYGRGVVDDKAGVMVHLAAIASYLRTHGSLPVNVKYLVEGEEEIGSDNLGSLLRSHKKMLLRQHTIRSGRFPFPAPLLRVPLKKAGGASCG